MLLGYSVPPVKDQHGVERFRTSRKICERCGFNPRGRTVLARSSASRASSSKDGLAVEGSSKRRVARVIGRSKSRFTHDRGGGGARNGQHHKTPRSDQRWRARIRVTSSRRGANNKGVQEIECIRGVSHNHAPSDEQVFRARAALVKQAPRRRRGGPPAGHRRGGAEGPGSSPVE